MYELHTDSPADALLQEALDLLLHGDAPGAVSKARAVQTQPAARLQPAYNGWALWMIGLAQITLNDIPAAETYLAQAQSVALTSQQSPLAMAVYLAQQLIRETQHHTELRQHVTRLLQQLEDEESRLTQQFRAMLKLATETWTGLAPPDDPRALPPADAEGEQAALLPIGAARPHLPPLEARCLGPFQVFQGGQELNLRPSKKSLDVFKYLLAHRSRPVAKDTLLHLLWPDATAGRGAAHRLHLAISGLRSMLNPGDQETSDYIQFRDDAYLINPHAQVIVDVDQFVAHYGRGQEREKAGRSAEAQAAYEAACALYRDDFLIENLYDDWTVPTRDHLRRLYLTMLTRLGTAYLRQARDEEAAACARRLLERDSCNEEAHGLLMRVYSRAGQRTQALRQYQLAADTLRKELNADPSPALDDLYRDIAARSA